MEHEADEGSEFLWSAQTNGMSHVLSAFFPFGLYCFNNDFQGFCAFPSVQRGEFVCKRKEDTFIFVEVCVKKRIYFSFKFFVMTGVGVTGFAESAKKGCIEFSHGGFVVINLDIFFVELFES